MKRQIWLEPSQVELVIDCLKYTKMKVEKASNLYDIQNVTSRFFARRVDEVLKILEQPKKSEGI